MLRRRLEIGSLKVNKYQRKLEINIEIIHTLEYFSQSFCDKIAFKLVKSPGIDVIKLSQDNEVFLILKQAMSLIELKKETKKKPKSNKWGI